jgi:hypothetical protein
MGRLAETVREQIADCAAASYASLSLPAAQRMMMFDAPTELGAYLQAHRVSGSAWRYECFAVGQAWVRRACTAAAPSGLLIR